MVFPTTSIERQQKLLRWANWLIYSSVVLGVILLAQLYLLNVPSFLLYSILAGWILYVLVAIAVWRGHSNVYPAALVLAIVTLAVSLPQPEHLSLAEAGPTLASITFILGSMLQLGVIVLVAYSMIIRRPRSNTGNHTLSAT